MSHTQQAYGLMSLIGLGCFLVASGMALHTAWPLTRLQWVKLGAIVAGTVVVGGVVYVLYLVISNS